MSTEIQIIQAIAEYLGLNAEDIDKKALLREDLGLGPLEINDLLAHLTAKFEVSIEPSDAENLKKVEDLVVLVEDNLIG